MYSTLADMLGDINDRLRSGELQLSDTPRITSQIIFEVQPDNVGRVDVDGNKASMVQTPDFKIKATEENRPDSYKRRYVDLIPV